jgi:elongation factor G
MRLTPTKLPFDRRQSRVLNGHLRRAKPTMLEPIMAVEVETPAEFTGRIQGNLLSRRGALVGSEVLSDYTVLRAEVPLAEMFGYSTQLRSLSCGNGNIFDGIIRL